MRVPGGDSVVNSTPETSCCFRAPGQVPDNCSFSGSAKQRRSALGQNVAAVRGPGCPVDLSCNCAIRQRRGMRWIWRAWDTGEEWACVRGVSRGGMGWGADSGQNTAALISAATVPLSCPRPALLSACGCVRAGGQAKANSKRPARERMVEEQAQAQEPLPVPTSAHLLLPGLRPILSPQTQSAGMWKPKSVDRTTPPQFQHPDDTRAMYTGALCIQEPRQAIVQCHLACTSYRTALSIKHMQIEDHTTPTPAPPQLSFCSPVNLQKSEPEADPSKPTDYSCQPVCCIERMRVRG